MAYQAPTITEAGRFADLTLGQPQAGPARDNTLWWGFIQDPWGDPGSR